MIVTKPGNELEHRTSTKDYKIYFKKVVRAEEYSNWNEKYARRHHQ